MLALYMKNMKILAAQGIRHARDSSQERERERGRRGGGGESFCLQWHSFFILHIRSPNSGSTNNYNYINEHIPGCILIAINTKTF